MNDEELIKETMMLDYSQLVMHNVYMIKENKRLENIIKEAKDFINGKDLKENEYRFAEDFNFTKLLEILDKENKQ